MLEPDHSLYKNYVGADEIAGSFSQSWLNLIERFFRDLTEDVVREGSFTRGQNGVDGWVNNPDTVKRVRELYPPSSVMRAKTENDRRVYLTAMAQIKQAMILGVDKNIYVEPAIWTIEWARDFYKYPVTRSN